MLHNNKRLSIVLLIIFFIIVCTKSDSVCDEEVLILELKQDLEDNGILDCLRIIKAPNGVIETAEQKNKRLAAQWDTSCSFESSYDWLSQLKKSYGISTLVDEIGEPIDKNIEDQADMCEIIRSAIAAGLFAPITNDVTEIPFEILNNIDCPGETGGRKICAANGVAYHKNDMWTIMLDGMAININGFPNFIRSNDNTKKYDQPQNTGPEINRELAKRIQKIGNTGNVENDRIVSNLKENTKDNSPPKNPWNRIIARYSTYKKETINSNQNWNTLESGNVEIKTNSDSFILVYSMISGYALKTRIAYRLLLDDVSQISSRMIQGYNDYTGLTTAFISEINSGTHKISSQYKASNKISIDLENKEQENVTTGVIILPTKELFIKKVINPLEFQLYNDNNWSDFPSLSITYTPKKSGWIIVLYNLSLAGMNSHIVTRADINNNPVVESRSIAGDSMYWGIHSAFLFNVNADINYKIKLQYRTPNPSKVNPRMNDWETQSLMALQLLDWVSVNKIVIDNEFMLNCENQWTIFEKMDIDLDLEEDKTILFLYSVVVPLVQKEMTVGIFMNNLLDKRSVITYSSTMYFKATGYYPIKLDKGKYKVQLKYKTDACVSYRPSTDWENISLTIVDFN